MPSGGMSITGDKALQRMLRELAPRTDVRVNRRAVNLAATPILSACKAECPVDEGDLRKALIKKVTNRAMAANAVIGADEDYTAANDSGEVKRPANYDHLVHDGHVTADGKVTAPNPFLARGWDDSIDDAQARYEQLLAQGIEAEAAKLGQP